jgi:hypothetical protein
MPAFSHPVFGSVGRAERPEIPAQHQATPAASEERPKSPDESGEPQMIPDDLQSLVECGKVTDTIEIDGKSFRMSTLPDEDQEHLFRRFSSAATDAGSFVELRRTVVAMAVEDFNGRPLESLCPAGGAPDAFAARMSLVRKMQGQVVERLYAFYEELLKRSRQKVDPEQVKN